MPKNPLDRPPGEYETPVVTEVTGEEKIIGVGITTVGAADGINAVITIDDAAAKLLGIDLTVVSSSDETNPIPKLKIIAKPQETHTDETMNKVRNALEKALFFRSDIRVVIDALQNAGILFRERNR